MNARYWIKKIGYPLQIFTADEGEIIREIVRLMGLPYQFVKAQHGFIRVGAIGSRETQITLLFCLLLIFDRLYDVQIERVRADGRIDIPLFIYNCEMRGTEMSLHRFCNSLEEHNAPLKVRPGAMESFAGQSLYKFAVDAVGRRYIEEQGRLLRIELPDGRIDDLAITFERIG